MSEDYDEYEFEYTKVTKTTRVINNREVKEKSPTSPTSPSSPTSPTGIKLLYGKDLKEYDNIPFDDLLNQLTEQELEELTGNVDPDDSDMPASMRCRDQTKKRPTGPLDRKKLLEFLKNFALEEEDWPENKPFQPGVKRGKVWQPKEKPAVIDEETKILLDLDDDASEALKNASEEDLVDLAGILGLHSMLNQDQYHASITNKGQKLGAKFESIVKATQPKKLPLLPDNNTNISQTTEQVNSNDSSLQELNWNNIKHISKETFKKLFEGLKQNNTLQTLDLANTGLTDGPAAILVDALKLNKTLKSLNLESNFLSAPMIRDMIGALNENQTLREFRAANQRPAILGNRIEMDIAKLVEQNNTLLRLGLSFDVPDARMRVAQRLQQNKDNLRLERIGSKTSIPAK